MATRSEVGIGVHPKHKTALQALVVDAFGEPDRTVDDDQRFIVIYDDIYWTRDVQAVKAILDWFDELPYGEWGWLEIFPGDEGPVIESDGMPYEFDFYYECKIVVGQ
jgi:hypothetical protein